MKDLQFKLNDEEKIIFTRNIFYDIQAQIDVLLTCLEEHSIEDFQTILNKAISEDNLSMLCFFVGMKERDLSSYFNEIKSIDED
jgi:hypothetical protein